MQVPRLLERFHQEHSEILQFLVDWGEALELAASEEQDTRCVGLRQLQAMEDPLAGITEHCRQEEEHVKSPFILYLDKKDMDRLRDEHERLRRLTNDFLYELRFATAARTDDMTTLGRELLDLLRKHIAHEEELLSQIEMGTEAEERLFQKYTHPGE